DLMAGSLSAKVSKISGRPGLDVSTGLSTFGVRGTQFEIALSVNATLFAVCEEGAVAVTTGGAESPLPAGQAIQQGEEGPPVPISFDPASIGELRGKWLDNEGAVFRKAPLKVLALFERRYSEHARAILGETRSLVLDPVFRKWIEEDRTGAAPDPLDPQVLRDKKRLMPKLVSLAKHIAVFERVWWRLNDMVDIVRNGEVSKQEIRKGLAVAKFVADFDRDRKDLERAIFVYHRALALYGERSPDSEDLLTTLGSGGLE
ncbi:MAG TPA: hypothetical protein VMV44_02650, partial [Rectinemataceae bacterium]|nr:hypothetical protein [Rectinemataceae bacterium]